MSFFGLLRVGRVVQGEARLRLADMRKGASAEERVGQVIEYALTSERGAVAHHVEDIAVSATLTTWWQRRAGSG